MHEKFTHLKDEIVNLKNVIKYIKKLQQESAHLKGSIMKMKHKVISLEATTYSVKQYRCRSNIEIHRIPNEVRNKNLCH